MTISCIWKSKRNFITMVVA